MKNRDSNSGSTDYMRRQMELVEKAQEEYRRRLEQRPAESKLVMTDYMRRQIALVEQAQAERPARVQQDTLTQNTDQERARCSDFFKQNEETPIIQNRDPNSGSTDYMQRQMALVEKAQAEYKQRLAQRPPEAKLVPSAYMLRQMALVEQAQTERAARIQQEAAKRHADQERVRLANKR